jgi:hypothetical protein
MENVHLKHEEGDGRVILRWILEETGCEDRKRMKLAQVRLQWRALAVMILKL